MKTDDTDKLKFGIGIDGFGITSFNFNVRKNTFHVVLENGLKVNQVELTPQFLIEEGIINTDKLKKFLP